MKVTNPMNTLFSGRVGNMIYYVRNGQTYARRMPMNEGKERTPKQREAAGRFGEVQAVYSLYKRVVSPEIWRRAAKAEGRMAHALFHSVNSKCFDSKGNLVDCEHFEFSRGEQLLPRSMQAVREGQRVRVTWEEEREWTTAAGSDRLCVGLVFPDYPLKIELLKEVTGVRSGLCGEFVVPEDVAGTVHAYCFFMREDGEAFSDSHYVRV